MQKESEPQILDYAPVEKFVESLIKVLNFRPDTMHSSKYGSGRSHEDYWISGDYCLNVYFQFAYDGEYYITEAKLSKFGWKKEETIFNLGSVYNSNHEKMKLSLSSEN